MAERSITPRRELPVGEFKRIQYWLALIDDFLCQTGLSLEPEPPQPQTLAFQLCSVILGTEHEQAQPVPTFQIAMNHPGSPEISVLALAASQAR